MFFSKIQTMIDVCKKPKNLKFQVQTCVGDKSEWKKKQYLFEEPIQAITDQIGYESK